MLTDRQKHLLRHWLILVILAELAMLIWRDRLPAIYAVIGLLFLGNSLLRVFKRYPGKAELLILDGSAAGISLIYAVIALMRTTGWVLLIILTSSLIFLPHLFYILNSENP